jgi:hypothetical protein
VSWHRAAALLTLARRIAGRKEGDWRADTAALIAEAAAVLGPSGDSGRRKIET